MTNHTTLEALLARVLEGEGPDRELDLAIAKIIGAKWYAETALPTGRSFEFRRFPARSDLAYTASLDAALTLVPEGWRWWVNSSGYARLWLPGNDGQAPQAIAYCEQRATPPRALIAACLKVRMEAQGE